MVLSWFWILLVLLLLSWLVVLVFKDASFCNMCGKFDWNWALSLRNGHVFFACFSQWCRTQFSSHLLAVVVFLIFDYCFGFLWTQSPLSPWMAGTHCHVFLMTVPPSVASLSSPRDPPEPPLKKLKPFTSPPLTWLFLCLGLSLSAYLFSGCEHDEKGQTGIITISIIFKKIMNITPRHHRKGLPCWLPARMWWLLRWFWCHGTCCHVGWVAVPPEPPSNFDVLSEILWSHVWRSWNPYTISLNLLSFWIGLLLMFVMLLILSIAQWGRSRTGIVLISAFIGGLWISQQGISERGYHGDNWPEPDVSLVSSATSCRNCDSVSLPRLGFLELLQVDHCSPSHQSYCVQIYKGLFMITPVALLAKGYQLVNFD